MAEESGIGSDNNAGAGEADPGILAAGSAPDFDDASSNMNQGPAGGANSDPPSSLKNSIPGMGPSKLGKDWGGINPTPGGRKPSPKVGFPGLPEMNQGIAPSRGPKRGGIGDNAGGTRDPFGLGKMGGVNPTYDRRPQARPGLPGMSNMNQGLGGRETNQVTIEQHTTQEYKTEWQTFMKDLKKGAFAGAEIAELLGGPYGDLVAEALGDVAGVAEAGSKGQDSRMGSNLAGLYAQRRLAGEKGLFGKKNMSAGKAAAASGAIAGALHGFHEGGAKGAVLEAGTTAANWYVLAVCFAGLFTIAGSIPCFIYLNLHYFLAKNHKKIFGVQFLPMSFQQKWTLIGIDALVGVAAILLIAIPLSICVGIANTSLLSVEGVAVRAVGYIQGYGVICDAISGFGGASASNSGANCPPVVYLDTKNRWWEIKTAQAQSACYNGPIGTGQWKDKINQYSQQANIDACALDTIVAKESSGNANAVGHDGGKRGDPDDFNANSPSRFGLNWDHSHGLGLTQLTIFPNGHRSGGSWPDPNKPQRNLVGQWYGVLEFLNPDTSLSVSAKYFASLLKSAGGNLQGAFTRYNGSGQAAEQYGADAMLRYQLCKSQSA